MITNIICDSNLPLSGLANVSQTGSSYTTVS